MQRRRSLAKRGPYQTDKPTHAHLLDPPHPSRNNNSILIITICRDDIFTTGWFGWINVANKWLSWCRGCEGVGLINVILFHSQVQLGLMLLDFPQSQASKSGCPRPAKEANTIYYFTWKFTTVQSKKWRQPVKQVFFKFFFVNKHRAHFDSIFVFFCTQMLLSLFCFFLSQDLTANKDITQKVIVCTRNEKSEQLRRILDEDLKGKKVLIFVATKKYATAQI